MSLSPFCPAVAGTPIPSNITLQLGIDSSLTTAANSLSSYGMSLRLHFFPCGSSTTFHTTNIFSLCLSVKINHKLEYIPLTEYMPWLFHLENIVTKHRAFGCESRSLTACSCHCWLLVTWLRLLCFAACGCSPLFVRNGDSGGVLSAFQHQPSFIILLSDRQRQSRVLCVLGDILVCSPAAWVPLSGHWPMISGPLM